MNERAVHQLRRRKIAMYEQLLPRGSLPRLNGQVLDDLRYGIYLSAVARIAPPGFGFDIGRRRRPSDLGMLGHLITSCATLGEIVDIWLCYASAGGELLQFELEDQPEVDGSDWSIRITPNSYLTPDVAKLCLDEMAAAFFTLAHKVTGAILSDFEVHVFGPEIAGIDYAAIFPCRIAFGAPMLRFKGPSSALALPVTAPLAETLDLLADEIAAASATGERFGHSKLKVYEYLLGRRGEVPTLDAAAQAIGLSRRTLVRRLQQEGTSFGEVLASYRRSYVMALCRDGALKPKQIAHSVGFRSENGLRKAFKTWTGQPIRTWIAQN